MPRYDLPMALGSATRWAMFKRRSRAVTRPSAVSGFKHIATHDEVVLPVVLARIEETNKVIAIQRADVAPFPGIAAYAGIG